MWTSGKISGISTLHGYSKELNRVLHGHPQRPPRDYPTNIYDSETIDGGNNKPTLGLIMDAILVDNNPGGYLGFGEVGGKFLSFFLYRFKKVQASHAMA